MTPSARKTLLALTCLTIAWLVPGCSPAKHRVTGRVQREGKPLVWKSDESDLIVIFVPLDRDRDKELYRALETDRKAGTFSIAAVPAGSYRVSIQQQDPRPTHDLLGFAYSIESSPIVYEVSASQTHFDIDLPRELPKKTKKEPG